MVTVRCFVCTCEKHLPPELYLQEWGSNTFEKSTKLELVEHDFFDLTRPSTIQLGYLVRFGLVAVEGAELAASIAEEYQEVLRLRARNLLQHFLFGLAVNNAGKNTVFNGIQDDSTIRFGRWLFIEFRTCECSTDKVRHIRIFSDISFYFLVAMSSF